MTSRSLTNRWRTAEGAKLAEEVVRCLAGNRSPADLVGTIDGGRADLRGLQLPNPRPGPVATAGPVHFQQLSETVELRGARWEGLDLSFARLSDLRLFDTTVVDCVFERANCRGWRLWASEVVDSNFDRADLRDSALGTWHDGKGNAWRRVTFRGGNLRDSVFLGAKIEGCDFSEATLQGVEFNQCDLRGGTFAGRLTGVVFDCRDLPDRPAAGIMKGVDFSAASFKDVEFWGCRFADVRLPNDSGVFLVSRYPLVARRALELLARDASVEARMLTGEWQNELRLPGRRDSAWVFNRRDYVASGGERLATLAETTIRRAEQEVARED